MKTILMLVSVTLAARADSIIPKSFERGRYAETIGQNPFVLEAKVDVTQPPPKPPLNWFLRGISKAEGKDYVLVQRIGEERAVRLIGNEPGEDQLSVKAVKVGSNFHETKVTLIMGTEMSEVGFKQDTNSAPPKGSEKGSRGVNPAIPHAQIPLPTPVAVPQAPGAPRQRVRVINN
jgi:hypothetical protein